MTTVLDSYNQNGQTLTVDLHPAPITLWGDESRLIQVLANLLQNSAKFTERHGQLRIALDSDNDQVVIRIFDNGRGMNAAHLRNIFLENQACQESTATVGQGLGIGLRLAKTIVELHGGTIHALSEGLGQGSTFEVRLPTCTDIDVGNIPVPPETAAADPDVCPQVPHRRIVVVDDDRSMRLLTSRILQKLNQQVEVADDGDTAIEMILRARPQAAFLDLQMHSMSGFEIARQLRSHAELDGLVLIALSGNSDTTSRELAFESGFDCYLPKPTSVAAISEILLRIPDLKRQRLQQGMKLPNSVLT